MNGNGNTGSTFTGGGPKYGWKNPPSTGTPWNADVLFEGNETSDNNYRNFNWDWHSGGVKDLRAQGVTRRGHISRNNKGPGIWCDYLCRNYIIERSIAVSNRGRGLFYELSSEGILRNNVVIRNSIHISGSSTTRVLNNTVYGSEIMVAGSERLPLNNNTVNNNIIANSGSIDMILFTTGGNKADNNLYFNSTGAPRVAVNGYGVNHRSLTTLRSAGVEANGLVGDPKFRDAAKSDFRLGAGSAALNRGLAVDAGSRDWYGGTRVMGGRLDVGAAEMQN